MDVLADLAGEDQMEAMKDKFGVGGMVDLLRTNAHNPLVAGLAADSLAEVEPAACPRPRRQLYP